MTTVIPALPPRSIDGSLLHLGLLEGCDRSGTVSAMNYCDAIENESVFLTISRFYTAMKQRMNL